MTDAEYCDLEAEEHRQEEASALALITAVDHDSISPDEIDDVLSEYDAPLRDEHGNITLHTERQADWALRKYAANERFAHEVDALANNYIARINGWREERKRLYVQNMGFLQALLYRWFAGWRTEHAKEKSCRLPHGTTGARKQQPQVKKDDAVLVKWLEDNMLPQYVKVEKIPNWSELKKACVLTGTHPVLKATGEEIEAVTLSYRPDEFYVKVSSDGTALTVEEEK